MNQAFLLLCAFCSSLVPLSGQEDWRLDFLRNANMETDTASLLKLHQFHNRTIDDLNRAISQLGVKGQEKRNAAYEEILRMQREMVLSHLRNLPENQEPEIQLRLDMVRKRIEWTGPLERQDLVRLAAEGLLYERENPGKVHSSRQMFVEFFLQPSDSLQKGYRGMEWRGDQGLDGKVSEQWLQLSGKRTQAEGDQRLVVTANKATGKATFPDRFRIDAKIGGKAGGEGSYHVGIAMGKVRALFHPGYEGGAFRFEKVDDRTELTRNEDMGFTPLSGSACDIRIDVQRLAKRRIKLSVELRGDQQIFRTTKEFDESVIGPLDHISLDRSGREGGDAIFRDLIIQFAPP